jgi:prevent-host-death family protein
MRSVGIKNLKNRLSEYVRAAAAGETVLVTDRDRVVAELVPPRRRRGLSDEEFVALGMREGWLTPAIRRGPLPEPTHPPVMGFDEMMADLAESREDR